jgi:hypothetical protein
MADKNRPTVKPMATCTNCCATVKGNNRRQALSFVVKLHRQTSTHLGNRSNTRSSYRQRSQRQN